VWFHATRATPDAKYADGILPTSAVSDRIWDFLAELVGDAIPGDEWARFRRAYPAVDAHGAKQFGRKFLDRDWEGPFAFLVRDAAVYGADDVGHRNFLARPPEYVEDICLSVGELFSVPLEQKYLAATRPCLVVFTAPAEGGNPVRAALNYVYAKIANREQTHWSLSIGVNVSFFRNLKSASQMKTERQRVLLGSVSWPVVIARRVRSVRRILIKHGRMRTALDLGCRASTSVVPGGKVRVPQP
jgi:hypothetical protein